MNKTNKIILTGFAVLLLSFLLVVVINSIANVDLFLKDSKTKIQSVDMNENLKNADSDNDGLSDFDEIYTYKTNPNDTDTDKDGYLDGLEVENGYDPLVSDLLVIEDPAEDKIDINSSEYEIKGNNSFLIEKIELEITNAKNKKKTILLDDFKKGDLNWSYILKASDNNLSEGKIFVAVLAHQKDKITKKGIIINVTLPDEEKIIKINVDWKKELIKLDNECEEKHCQFDYYLAGEITDGEYKKQALYLEVEFSMGNVFRHYILKNGEKFYLKDNNIEIEELANLPKTIVAPAEKYTLEGGRIGNPFFTEIEIADKLFVHERMGDIYLTEDGCAVAELPDHTAFAYSFIVPFVNKENGLHEIVFNNGDENKEEYDHSKITGCGALCYHLNVMNKKELIPDEQLQIAGKASNGDFIYELKNINDKILKDLYDDENSVAYYGEDWKKTDGNKYSYEEFMNLRPLLYWQDPLERWIQLKNRKFILAAEMCKPVIYLYPEEKIEVSVQVNPNGGFTFTKPEYGGGWSVEVSRDGEIRDLKTNQKYDYLYWEGIGLNYPKRKEGFAVKKENLDQFFNQKLSLLGLNKKEIGDFKKYWLKRLSEKPYYKISFLTQDEFNRIAPIKFSPINPKTVIRVMMTAESLNKFEFIPEQELFAAPARNGFTAVEWGGTLLR